jgi:ABC-type sulfate transport system substrate-binding protein
MSFPAKVKKHSTLVSVLKKSIKKAVKPNDQITIKSPVAIVKDLITKNTTKKMAIGGIVF